MTNWKKLIYSGSDADLRDISASSMHLSGIGDVSESIALALDGGTLWQSVPQGIATADNSHKVGIGTTNPSYKLAVSSSSDTHIHIQSQTQDAKVGIRLDTLRAGSQTMGPSLLYKQDSSTYLDSDEAFYIRPNGSTGLLIYGNRDIRFISSSQSDTIMTPYFHADNKDRRIGIGTITPPEKLTVQGNISASGDLLLNGNIGIGTTTPGAKLEVYSSENITAILNSNNTFTFLDIENDGANRVQIGNASDGDFIIRTADTERLRVDSSGNIGIGTTTPAYRLQIAAADSYKPLLSLKNTSSDISQDVIMSFNRDNSDTQGYSMGIDSANNSFKITEDGDSINANQRLTILTGGNVGIGTITPARPLQVAYNSTTAPGFSIKNINTTANNNVVMAFNRDGSDELGWSMGIESSNDSFKISEDGDNVENNPRITILAGGNVGVGNSNPPEALTVTGDISASGDLHIEGSTVQSGDLTLVSSSLNIETFGEGVQFYNGTNYSNKIKLTTAQNMQFIAGGSHQFSAQSVQILNGKALIFEDSDNTDSIRLRNNVAAEASGARLDITDESYTPIMSISSSGNVGIGTVDPAYSLDFGTNASTIRLVSENNGTAIRIGAGGGGNDVSLLRVDGQTTNHDGESDSGQLGFSLKYMGSRSGNLNSLSIFSDNQTAASAIEALTILQDGNIGIGAIVPTRQLHVKDTGATVAVKIESADSSQASVDLQNSEGAFRIINDAGALDFYDDAGSDTTRIHIKSGSGNVGIGTSTPNQKFEVKAGNINIQNGDGGFLTFNNGDANITIHYNGSGRDLSFKTYDGSSNSERMRINKDGKVGIGTSSPSNQLHLYEAGNSNAQLYIQATGSNGNENAAGIKLFAHNNYTQEAFVKIDDDGLQIGTTDNEPIRFFTDTNVESLRLHHASGHSADVEFHPASTTLFVSQSGKVGIGTDSPTEALEVVGNINVKNGNISASGHISASALRVENDAQIQGDLGIGGTIFGLTGFGVTIDDIAVTDGSTNFGSGSNPAISIHSRTGSMSITGSTFTFNGEDVLTDADIYWHDTGTTITSSKSISVTGSINARMGSAYMKFSGGSDFFPQLQFGGGNARIGRTGDDLEMGGTPIHGLEIQSHGSGGQLTVGNMAGHPNQNNIVIGMGTGSSAAAYRITYRSDHHAMNFGDGNPAIEITESLVHINNALITGSLEGTASFVVTASYAITASYAENAGSTIWYDGDTFATASVNVKISGSLDIKANQKDVLRLYGRGAAAGVGAGIQFCDINDNTQTGTFYYAHQDSDSNNTDMSFHFDGNGSSTAVILNQTAGNSGYYIGSTDEGVSDPNDYKVAIRAAANSYFNGGNVGIGTATPNEKLSVNGNIELTTGADRRIYMGGQAGTTFGIAYNSSFADYGIFYTEGSPDKVNISPNGNATAGVMTLVGDGNVGIGQTSPSTPLHIAGANTLPQLTIENTSGGGGNAARIIFKPSNTRDAGPYISSNARGATSANGDIRIGDETGDIMTINDGNVGIGQTSPGSLLELKNVSYMNFITMDRTDNTNIDQKVYLTPSYDGAGNTAMHIVIGESPTYARFAFTEAGRVGIGTTSPADTLEVVGGIRAQNAILTSGPDSAALGQVAIGEHNGQLQIKGNSGTLSLGPEEGQTNFTHILASVGKFYFNKEIIVDDGVVSSYNEDLILRRVYNDTGAGKNNQIKIGDDSLEIKLDNSPRLSIEGLGKLTLGAYGSGTHTGTLVKSLGVDSSGNVIEFDAASSDADTLDGINSTSFLRSDEPDTATGLITLDGGLSVLSGTGGGKLRIKRNVGSTDGDDIVDIHLTDSTIYFDMDNDNDADGSNFYFRYKTGGAFSNLLVFNKSTITYKGNTILTTAQEGSGNGIDADTVDGHHASDFLGVNATATNAANAALLDNIDSSQFLRSDEPDTATSLITLTGGLKVSGTNSDAQTSEIIIEGGAPQIKFNDTGTEDNFYIHVNSNRFYVLADRDDNDGWEGTHPLQLDASNNTAQTFGNKILTTADEGSGNGIDADTVDGVHADALKKDTHTSFYPGNDLAVGWYTIAIIPNGRAHARFGIRDQDSGRHASVTFYATHHYGNGNQLTVLTNGKYSTEVFGKIRIKDSGTYDGAALQVYISNAANSVTAFLLGDNYQTSGWTLLNWIPDATDPGVNTGANSSAVWTEYGTAAEVDLSDFQQGMAVTRGSISGSFKGDGSDLSFPTRVTIGSHNTLNENTLTVRHSGGDHDQGIMILREDGTTTTNELLGGIGFDSSDGNIPSQITEASAYIAAYAAESQGPSDKGGYLEFGTSKIDDNDDTASHPAMRINHDQVVHFKDDIVAFSTTVSDRRLKTNIQLLTGSLDTICNLEGVRYDWKYRDSGPQLGVIAQQVEPHVPEIIKETELPLHAPSADDDTKYKTVDYEQLVPHLIEAIKELKTEVDELKSRLNDAI